MEKPMFIEHLSTELGISLSLSVVCTHTHTHTHFNMEETASQSS